MADTISWIATVATIIAASMTASNLGSRITGYGFCVFLIGSFAWLTAGLMSGQPALVWTNVVLTVLNIFGIWRWLGRQVRIEEGASFAAETSRESTHESLFPISQLMKTSVTDFQGKELGTCVDAMAGCVSGQLRYVVASQGGLGGVGETLRRVPWTMAQMNSEKLVVGANDLGGLQEVEKDEWPSK